MNPIPVKKTLVQHTQEAYEARREFRDRGRAYRLCSCAQKMDGRCECLMPQAYHADCCGMCAVGSHVKIVEDSDGS